MPYATRDDVFILALSARAFVTSGMLVEHVDLGTGVLRIPGHGLNAADKVTVDAPSGGSLATGLEANKVYGVDPVAFDLFRLTDDGTPITSFAEAGKGLHVVVDQMRRLDAHLEAASARIDEHLTAHGAPLAEPYPVQVVEICARLAARRAVVSLQFENPEFRVAVDRLRETFEQDEQTLQRWLSGKPINPRPTDQTPVADNGARARSSRKADRWRSGVL